MSDNAAILAKIKKCLALSKSSNEHEAAAALRQAQALMRKHDITDRDILLAEVSEADTPAGAKKTPIRWEASLSHLIARAFNCDHLLSTGFSGGRWKFIGPGSAPEVAAYAFSVLARQLRKARAEFIATKCKRLIRASKTRRADLFCEGWVAAVRQLVANIATTSQAKAAIGAYMAKHYPDLGDFTPRNRQGERAMLKGDYSARSDGWQAGKAAQLRNGLAGQAKQAALSQQ
ncbi:DUF2786 domain-containing protein [Chromobacterium haemolyticum]|uniref:DUF2786 domain-containing protein n=1 Tax=Chromobacterium fluminis TaxID=3044269 RepID=A0ABX0L805_9NEIS|nr:DUF2786 domain-containing protein [Chromobacterium haemolyticum]NHR07959.1 DUF2786 domain-containing protein [Chromobacterium haemolyticum]